MKEIFMRFPGGKARAVTFGYDDAPEADKRLVGIFQKYGLKGTFFVNAGRWAKEGTPSRNGVPPHRTMTRSEAIETFKDSGMEIASHGYHHRFWNLIPGHEVFQEIHQDRLALEKDFGCLVRGVGCPYGDLTKENMDVIRSYGLLYFRQSGNSHSFKLPEDWLCFQPTCHHKDPELMELAKQFAEKPVRFAPTMFCVGGHSWEFDTRDTWYLIEDFAKYIHDKPDIWFATIGQICAYTLAFRQLVFSADMQTVYNPTCTTLHIQVGDAKFSSEQHIIGPGQTIRLEDDL